MAAHDSRVAPARLAEGVFHWQVPVIIHSDDCGSPPDVGLMFGPMDKKAPAKALLTRVGRFLQPGRRLRVERGLQPPARGLVAACPRIRAAGEVSDARSRVRKMAESIADRDVLRLEFGIRKGVPIRQWSRLLRNPRSVLHGFDSFFGLPHDWTLEGHASG